MCSITVYLGHPREPPKELLQVRKRSFSQKPSQYLDSRWELSTLIFVFWLWISQEYYSKGIFYINPQPWKELRGNHQRTRKFNRCQKVIGRMVSNEGKWSHHKQEEAERGLSLRGVWLVEQVLSRGVRQDGGPRPGQLTESLSVTSQALCPLPPAAAPGRQRERWKGSCLTDLGVWSSEQMSGLERETWSSALNI